MVFLLQNVTGLFRFVCLSRYKVKHFQVAQALFLKHRLYTLFDKQSHANEKQQEMLVTSIVYFLCRIYQRDTVSPFYDATLLPGYLGPAK